MKTIKDYLRENGDFKCDLGNRTEVGFALAEDNIIMMVDTGVATDIYKLEIGRDVQDVLYDDYNIEIRFCEECGKPFDAGFTAGDGEWYCCEDCFESVMDRDYGKGKWRATEEEGEYGGFYEYLDNNRWEDTAIFYTEWY